MHYKKPNLVHTYVEVAANDKFEHEMRAAAGSDGVHPTEIRSVPLAGEEAHFNKSRLFMVFTGSADSNNGRPNPAQNEVLQRWGAKVSPDREAWKIDHRVADDIAKGREPAAPQGFPICASPAAFD